MCRVREEDLHVVKGLLTLSWFSRVLHVCRAVRFLKECCFQVVRDKETCMWPRFYWGVHPNRLELHWVAIRNNIRGTIHVFWDLAPQLFLLPVLVTMVTNGWPLLPRMLYTSVQGFACVSQSLVERHTFSWVQLGEIRETLRRMEVNSTRTVPFWTCWPRAPFPSCASTVLTACKFRLCIFFDFSIGFFIFSATYTPVSSQVWFGRWKCKQSLYMHESAHEK